MWVHYLIRYDTIYLLTVVGQPPGGSRTVHIYTQIIHRTTQNKQCIEQYKNYIKQHKNNIKQHKNTQNDTKTLRNAFCRFHTQLCHQASYAAEFTFTVYSNFTNSNTFIVLMFGMVMDMPWDTNRTFPMFCKKRLRNGCEVAST